MTRPNRHPQRGDVLWYRSHPGRIVIVLDDKQPPWQQDPNAHVERSYVVLIGLERKRVSALHLRWPD